MIITKLSLQNVDNQPVLLATTFYWHLQEIVDELHIISNVHDLF